MEKTPWRICHSKAPFTIYTYRRFFFVLPFPQLVPHLLFIHTKKINVGRMNYRSVLSVGRALFDTRHRVNRALSSYA